MLKRADIKAAIAASEGAIANQSLTEKHGTIATAVERREILTSWARANKNPVAAIKAVDVLNKMDAVYIQKHEHQHVIPGAITFVVQPQVGAENRT